MPIKTYISDIKPLDMTHKETVSNKCTHNVMITNNDKEFVWKCADCGYVYGEE